MFVFEDQCGLLWGETVGQGDRDSTLKGCTQNLTPSWTQGKSNNLKGVWVTTPADFGESPGKVGGNGAYHQQTDTGGGHFQDLVLPLDTGAGKNHFGNLQAYQHWYLVRALFEVERFYEDLQDLLELTPKKDVFFIIVDWNAKVGSQEIPGVTGKFGLGLQNEAGQRLTEFCQEDALVIAKTLFQQHKNRLYTWTSLDSHY